MEQERGVEERNDGWVLEINDKASKMESIPKTELPIKKKKAIFKITFNEGTLPYTPRVVSFGPYHHGNISCEKTNEYKKDVLVHCLKRSGKRLEDYLQALREEVQDLKDAYDELNPCWQQDDDAFLKLMIHDGCFFLEILDEEESSDEKKPPGYIASQILTVSRISRKELKEYYKHDMLLLENQLPMLLLVKLFSVQNNLPMGEAKEKLHKRTLRFIAPTLSPNIAEKLQEQDLKCTYLHVLDLYRRSLLHQKDKGKSLRQILEHVRSDVAGGRQRLVFCFIFAIPTMLILMPAVLILIPFMVFAILIGIITVSILVLARMMYYCTGELKDVYFIIPSAMELDKLGIKFKMNKTKNLKDISLGITNTMRLPEIYVDGESQSTFLNIIAFEQFQTNVENDVTSYIYFMSRLIESEGDVCLLRFGGIIHTPLHNDQVVEWFKSMTKDIVHDPKSFLVPEYLGLGDKLTDAFHRKMNNAWQRDLLQTYLKSPWAFISIVAAIWIFGSTSVQTVYTVLGYYNDSTFSCYYKPNTASWYCKPN